MALLILGLLMFLGAHSMRILAPQWRERVIARGGAGRWKGIYAIVSLVGFVLIILGFAHARQDGTVLYVPPMFLRHLNALFTLLAFILVTAAYVPRNHLKSGIGHPMVAGVKTWALGHLLATGMLHDVILFGAFLLWAIAQFAVSRRRDRLQGVKYPAGTVGGDLLTVFVGVLLWAVFAFWLHLKWIGVNPFV
jgi:uncharacterized membrane protein